MNAQLFARHALLPGGWAVDVLIEWDAGGTLAAVTPGSIPVGGTAIAELVLPGMVNLHSHAFQRALAGLTETAGDNPDSFWTWRELMYRFARKITPEQIEAIAAQLFAECLRYGYTAVCEFHYVQRAHDGSLYPRPAETAERVVAASRAAGIGLTMLPVLYSYAGFGELPLGSDQQRFRTDPAQVLKMVEALEPLHIHIAEQQDEVLQCHNATGMRPLRFLAEHVELDERWGLVHATHIDADEVERIVDSGAVAGLCPTTEANLGDGLFPLAQFVAAGGRFGIGSDSHVSQSPVEELRWLEYGQRLQHQRRNVAVSHAQRKVGEFLWQGALQGGAQASGRKVGALAAGMRADLLVLDSEHPNLDGALPDDVLGIFVFSGNVLAGGRWVVRDGRHVDQDAIARRYKVAITELREYRS